MKTKNILVTGAAGFIGNSLAHELLGKVKNLICVDNFNNYYDPELKEKRFNRLMIKAKSLDLDESNFSFHRIDLRDKETLKILFQKNIKYIIIAETKIPVISNFWQKCAYFFSK